MHTIYISYHSGMSLSFLIIGQGGSINDCGWLPLLVRHKLPRSQRSLLIHSTRKHWLWIHFLWRGFKAQSLVLAFSSLGDAKKRLAAVNGLFLAVLDASGHVHIHMIDLRTNLELAQEMKIGRKIQRKNPLAVAKQNSEKVAQLVIILQLWIVFDGVWFVHLCEGQLSLLLKLNTWFQKCSQAFAFT